MHRLTGLIAAEDEELELLEIGGVETSAQLVLAVGDFDRASAGLLEGALHRREHVLQRDAALAQQRRKELHLILLFETADRRHFGNTWRRLQGRLDQALVQEAQLTQVARLFVIDERVLEDPPHAAGVRADGDVGIRRQLRANGVETILDELTDHRTAARVLQNHVYER